MGTIRKVGDVLRLFSVNEPELGLSDISRRMGMSTSGCHDLMDGLRKIGMVSRVGRGRYRLGPMISSLYRVLIDTSALVDTARPTLERLVPTEIARAASQARKPIERGHKHILRPWRSAHPSSTATPHSPSGALMPGKAGIAEKQ